MIGFLKGRVDSIFLDYCLLDVAGVGYRVFISTNTRGQLKKGQEIKLITHLNVREDVLQLYGFLNQDEYELFELLITVSGIGTKVAMGIIGAITPEGLSQAVHNKNVKTLTSLPGIGKKTAERLILELKEKLNFTADEDGTGFDGNALAGADVGDDIYSEAAAALLSLGYGQAEVSTVFQSMGDFDGSVDVQTIIKRALKELSGR